MTVPDDLAEPAALFVTEDGDLHPSMSSMRICIDARMLRADGTGVARYARTLIDSLAQAGMRPLLLHADLDGTKRLARWIASTRLASRFAHERPSCIVSSADRSIIARDVFREAQLHFNIYGRVMPIHCEGPPGVMHWTYPVPVMMRGWRNVYTIHDVIPLNGRGLSPIRARRHRRLLRAIARQADRLVTVSKTAQREIVDELGCDPCFVTDTSQAVSVIAGPDLGGSTEAGSYFLFCGTLEPRKNLLRLAEAYKRSDVRRKLIIVGPDGWRAGLIRSRLDDLGIEILPFQPRERLMNLMRNARALLFPSLSEGFGLPIAEAMTLGTPVMTSSHGATAEIAGDAALLVDPYDIDAMAETIRRLDGDTVLCNRLKIAGLKRSIAFRALPYGQRMIAFYAELLDAPRRDASQTNVDDAPIGL